MTKYLWIFIATYSLIYAEYCKDLAPHANINENLEADIRGSANSILRTGINGNLNVYINKKTTDIYNNHKDANKAIIKSKLIYIICNVIQNSDNLTNKDKLDYIKKLYESNKSISKNNNTYVDNNSSSSAQANEKGSSSTYANQNSEGAAKTNDKGGGSTHTSDCAASGAVFNIELGTVKTSYNQGKCNE